jgi:hypothetical protein
MIKSITEYKEDEEKDKKISDSYNNLIKNFNLESKKQKYKYRLKQDGENVCLLKISFFINTLGNNEINYNYEDDSFYFDGGIDEEIFNEIKSILNELKEVFNIEIIKEEN